MESKSLQPDKSISLFVKNILVLEEPDATKYTSLPFFADGCPGLMFQDTDNGLRVQPHNKEMPLLFLYGQTIHPIELEIKGRYSLLVFQLYPFILKSFFDVTATDINDNCYDLAQSEKGNSTAEKLLRTSSVAKRVAILTDYLFAIFKEKQKTLDLTIKQAIQFILDSKGTIAVNEICNKIHLTQRTFERRFLKETGIPPVQFSKMIRFQQSLEQLTSKDYKKLTDIVYDNGFADQSHFIRVFKAFTGKTPKRFLVK